MNIRVYLPDPEGMAVEVCAAEDGVQPYRWVRRVLRQELRRRGMLRAAKIPAPSLGPTKPNLERNSP